MIRGVMHMLVYLSPNPSGFQFPDQSISPIVSPSVLIIMLIEGSCDVWLAGWLLLSPASWTAASDRGEDAARDAGVSKTFV